MSEAPFLPFARPDITEAEVTAATDVILSGWLTTGVNAKAFEQEFAEFLASDVTAIAVNSATAGQHLALESLGVGPDAGQMEFASGGHSSRDHHLNNSPPEASVSRVDNLLARATRLQGADR